MTSVKWTGGVTADSDFAWDVEYYEGQIYIGRISAPGKTVSLTSTRSEWNTVFLTGEVDADLVVETATLCVQLQGVSSNPCNTLTVKSQRLLEMASAASWGGRLVIANTGAKVDLLGASNLLPTSFVIIDDGGAASAARLNLDKYGYTIRGFSYNGAVTASGEASAATVGAAISGANALTIDSSIKMWTGGASGAWSAAANWETQEAPVSAGRVSCPASQGWGALTFVAGTVVEIPKGSVLRGESLALGGTSLARGRYSSAKLTRLGMDGYLDGEGKIQVGDPLGSVLFVR